MENHENFTVTSGGQRDTSFLVRARLSKLFVGHLTIHRDGIVFPYCIHTGHCNTIPNLPGNGKEVTSYSSAICLQALTLHQL